LDDEIVEIWENKMQPHMTQSQVPWALQLNLHLLCSLTHAGTVQVSGLTAPSADNQGLVRLANKIQSVRVSR